MVERVGNGLLDGAKIAADVELSIASKCVSIANLIVKKETVTESVAIVGGVVITCAVITQLQNFLLQPRL